MLDIEECGAVKLKTEAILFWQIVKDNSLWMSPSHTIWRDCHHNGNISFWNLPITWHDYKLQEKYNVICAYLRCALNVVRELAHWPYVLRFRPRLAANVSLVLPVALVDKFVVVVLGRRGSFVDGRWLPVVTFRRPVECLEIPHTGHGRCEVLASSVRGRS